MPPCWAEMVGSSSDSSRRHSLHIDGEAMVALCRNAGSGSFWRRDQGQNIDQPEAYVCVSDLSQGRPGRPDAPLSSKVLVCASASSPVGIPDLVFFLLLPELQKKPDF